MLKSSTNLKSIDPQFRSFPWNFVKRGAGLVFYATIMDALHCTNRDVAMLLRRAANPRALAASPLMTAVCRATGNGDAVAALRHVVGLALAGADSAAGADLRDAIFEADFERAATNAQLALRSGVSRRHFQRRRARAVEAIARYARRRR